MKRISSILLAACLVLGLCIPAYALPAWDDPVNTITSPGGTVSVPVNLTTVGDSGSNVGGVTVGTRLNFKVQLPTNLPVSLNAENRSLTAMNAYITNLSSGAVEVTNVSIEPVNGWTVLDYGTDMSGNRVNTKSFSMRINGLSSQANGKNHMVFDQDRFMKAFAEESGTNYLWAATYGYNAATAKWGAIPSKHGKARIFYDVAVPAQNRDLYNDTIANVLFTVGFAYAR